MGKVNSVLEKDAKKPSKSIWSEYPGEKAKRSLSFVELPEIKLNQIVQHENIGWGATGVIKRCEYEGQEVAVKFLFPDADTIKFREELKHWSSIEHQNVVTVYAACIEPKKLCMVMEYMKGGSLKSYLRSRSAQRPATWPFLYRIAIDVAYAMKHLHETGHLVHRDIKSENILLNSFDAEGVEPVAKLCDFGDCRKQSHVMTPDVGTISYMAPEMMEGCSYSNKVDVYSYGVLLWELITRQEPFGDEMYLHDIAEKVIQGKRLPLPEYCPPSVSQLIQQCWRQDPDERPTFKEILERLRVLGKLWDHSQVDQLLADVGYATTDTETERESKNWDETTFTDLELGASFSPCEVSIEGSAEEEQELSSRKEPRKSRRVTISVHSPQVANKKPPTPHNTRKLKKRPQHKTLPKEFKSKGNGSLPKINTMRKSSPISSKYGSDDMVALRERNISQSDSSGRVRAVKSATLVAQDQLRELSKARSNLHQLLATEEESYPEAESGLVIQVLRASLHRESERVQFLKQENELLTKSLKIESKQRNLLEQQLQKSRKELNRKSACISASIVHSKGDGASKDSFTHTLEKYKEEDKADRDAKWSEIEFGEIICESIPYYYCSFAIWFKAKWKSIPVRLCMSTGSIYRELLTKFRKLSTVIQQLTNHPNLCNVLGVVSKAPNFGILLGVQPSAVELKELIGIRKLTLQEKVLILRSIAVAVNHCHSHSRSLAWLNNRSVFVHPDTLETQVVHVCNLFYFSQRLDTQWEKFRWQAPEVFYGRNKSSTSADCFSIGLLIWYLITETEPYDSFDSQVAEKLSSGWRLSIPDDIPEELSDIITLCWKKKPEERLSAKETTQRLHQFYQSLI